ncbi:MAG TPA: tripartite tricarboxylate transporter substrate binding protein [Xanthobacteraceae bacterium]|nr:tripartite tricarboxylate transporter substrate binding protein [Xanthobacteraceae bacterium]
MSSLNFFRRLFTFALIALGLVAFGGQAVHAQSATPITMIVPFTPGTGIDILARAVGEEIQKRWDRPVVVENKPGASGNIGTAQAARAAPDGNTLMMTVVTFVMNAPLFKTLPYDPVKSFTPIVHVANGGLALTVHPSVPAETAKAFIEHVKAQPGKLNYASPGPGTPQHLAMELLKLKAKIDLVHVPYRGSAGAVKDLVGGHVSAMFLPVHTVLPLAGEKQVRVLGVGSAKRLPVAPDVPTMAEQGLDGFEIDLWYGLMAPAGTPADVVARYNTTVNEILREPGFAATLAKQGLLASGGTPEALRDLIAAELKKWANVVGEAGIAAQ